MAPKLPQAVSEVPAWHTPLAQHPSGQVVALHVEAPTHVPDWQLSLVLQRAHAAPAVPH